MELDTIIGSKVRTAVRVGPLYIPANSLTNHLRRYSEPALFHTEGVDPYSISKAGSLFKARIGEKYFAFACSHQFGKGAYGHDQLCLVDQRRNMLVSSGGAVFPEPRGDEETDFDCNLYDFSGPVREGLLSEDGWYDLSAEMSVDYVPKPELVFGFGYPGYRNSIDYVTMQYGISPNSVCGIECSPAMTGRLSFRPEPAIDYEPSGMSVGPVFCLVFRGKAPAVHFAGVITNASSQCFNFLPITRIHPMIKHILTGRLG